MGEALNLDWSRKNLLKIGSSVDCFDAQIADEADWMRKRQEIEPWLAAVFQSEHLSLLVGNGLTLGVCGAASVTPPGMGLADFGSDWNDRIKSKATEQAQLMGRGEPNLEDQLRVATELHTGLVLLDDPSADDLRDKTDAAIKDFIENILSAERDLAAKLEDPESEDGVIARHVLSSFILAISSRTASRERLGIFTTNYDRLIEYALDLLGMFTLDHFRGSLRPRFNSTKLEIDYHYSPPGIRGEPRFMEGVVRLSKLHGSIDWRFAPDVVREALPFGAASDHPAIGDSLADSAVVFPNSSKDIETAFYPYAELLRDFSASVCRPNTALVAYGYGFGDSHINRVVKDMLSIPSTHLVVVSFDGAGDRIKRFCEQVNLAQVTLMMGPEFGDIGRLVERYMPKPAIDRITSRKVELLKRRDNQATANGDVAAEVDDGSKDD